MLLLWFTFRLLADTENTVKAKTTFKETDKERGSEDVKSRAPQIRTRVARKVS